MLLDFSQGSAGQLVHPHETAWDFERGKCRLAAGFKNLRIEVAAAYNVGHWDLSSHLVWNTGNSSLGYFLLLQKELFDLPRINVEAAADNYIASPSLERVVAVFRTLAEIPGPKIAINERRSR